MGVMTVGTSREQELATELEAVKIDLAAARRINARQFADIERLQVENRRLREHRGGWGDR